MSFPQTINPNIPQIGDIANLTPAEIRALAQAIIDIFGLPAAPSTINAAAFSIASDGHVTLPAGPPLVALGAATKSYVDNATLNLPVLQAQGLSNAFLNSSCPAGQSRPIIQVVWAAPSLGTRWTPFASFILNFTSQVLNSLTTVTAALTDSTGNLFNVFAGSTAQTLSTTASVSCSAALYGRTSVAAGTPVTFTVTAYAQGQQANFIGFPTPGAVAASNLMVNWVPST